jgi:protein dithiol:quinone oxidoreductase
MITITRPRTAFAVMFAACAGLIAFALYLQHALTLEPCPMCILQRYAFIAIALVALIATLHDPRGFALTLYGGLVILFGIVGSGIAIRHSWVQHFPPPNAGCGIELEFLMEVLPLTDLLPAIFRGSGECSKVDWRFIGLSIPEWALVWFVVFVVFTLVVLRRARIS